MAALEQALPGHGLTAIEASIMERFDAGDRAIAIADALGLGHRRVQMVIDCYREGRSDRWEEDAARGSRELLAAIRRQQVRTAI